MVVSNCNKGVRTRYFDAIKGCLNCHFNHSYVCKKILFPTPHFLFLPTFYPTLFVTMPP